MPYWPSTFRVTTHHERTGADALDLGAAQRGTATAGEVHGHRQSALKAAAVHRHILIAPADCRRTRRYRTDGRRASAEVESSGLAPAARIIYPDAILAQYIKGDNHLESVGANVLNLRAAQSPAAATGKENGHCQSALETGAVYGYRLINAAKRRAGR